MPNNLPLNVASLPNLGPGSTDSASVTALQQALVSAGYMRPDEMATGPGIYGPKTTAAVAKWQAENGINTQGNPGWFGPISKGFILKTPAASSGTGSGTNLQAIDPTLPRDEYSTTSDGQASAADTDNNPADGVLPPGIGTQTVYNLSPEAFNTLVPQLTPGTPEFQAAMDKIDTSFYDILQQQMTAQTEQQHQIADYNWEKLREYISTNLNVQLSNNSLQAWDQLQGIKNQFGTQNLQGSGLQEESIDQYLRKVRMNDSNQRLDAQSKQEKAEQDYYTKFATPAEIKKLVLEKPELARRWGLVPSAEIAASMTPAALKAKYPNMTDEEISNSIASTLDENGNFRSGLYQKFMVGEKLGVNSGGVDESQTVYDPTARDQNGNPLPVRQRVAPGDAGILDIQNAAGQNKTLGAYNAGQMAYYNARKDAGLIPSDTSSNPDKNTQFITAKPNNTSGSAGLPTNTTPATTTNPLPVFGPASSTKTEPSSSPTYTFKKNPMGMIERYNKGVRESTGTADSMKSFGYTG